MSTGGRIPSRPLACLAAVVVAGCTIPVTAQTLTGGALNAGALFLVDERNDDYDGDGTYRYEARVELDTLAAVFETAVATANRAHMFPPIASERSDAASRKGLVPRRQWTPVPPFSLRGGDPEVHGDTVSWVVTHRARRRVSFRLVGHSGRRRTTVLMAPYEPPGDVLLSVAQDHAQRNAVEALREVFYFAAVGRLGPDALLVARTPEAR